MLKKYHKFYARWSAPDRSRHTKAFPTAKAAAHYQRKMHALSAAKKAQPTAKPSRRSPKHGPKTRRRTNRTAASPKS
jgi:hypothetical protein